MQDNEMLEQGANKLSLEKLNEILNQKDTQKILTAFLDNGFKDMTKDPVLKKFSLENIAKSDEYLSSEYFESWKIGFSATLHYGIKDLPNHQVIWLQTDDIDRKTNNARPRSCYIYFKVIK